MSTITFSHYIAKENIQDLNVSKVSPTEEEGNIAQPDQ